MKDITSKTRIPADFHPDMDGEFNIDVHRILTRKNIKKIKVSPTKYKFGFLYLETVPLTPLIRLIKLLLKYISIPTINREASSISAII